MNRAEFVKKFQEKAMIEKTKDADNFVKCFLDTLKDDVFLANDSITFTGFGTFRVSNRKARIGRNPQTGEAVDIPAKKSIKFKLGKAIADQLKPDNDMM